MPERVRFCLPNDTVGNAAAPTSENNLPLGKLPEDPTAPRQDIVKYSKDQLTIAAGALSHFLSEERHRPTPRINLVRAESKRGEVLLPDQTACYFSAKHIQMQNCTDTIAEVKRIVDQKSNPSVKKINNREELHRKISESQSSIELLTPRVLLDSPFNGYADTFSKNESIEFAEDLQTSLEWIRKELLAMRQMDQDLARQLLHLNLTLQRARLEQAREGHSDMLESVALEAQLEQEQSRCHWSEGGDLQLEYTHSLLEGCRKVGLTKRNIAERKFSLA